MSSGPIEWRSLLAAALRDGLGLREAAAVPSDGHGAATGLLEPGAVTMTFSTESGVPSAETQTVYAALNAPVADADAWAELVATVRSSRSAAAPIAHGDLPVGGDGQADDLVDEFVNVLIPATDTLGAECSCPSTGKCRHLRTLTAWLLSTVESDPWSLVVWRGGNRSELRGAALAALGASPAHAWEIDSGTRPADAWPRIPSELPAVPTPPTKVRRVAHSTTAPPAESGIRPADLADLAADAADRALDLIGGTDRPYERADHEMLAVVASRIERTVEPVRERVLRVLAERYGVEFDELSRQLRAWQVAGAQGLSALMDSWDPDPVEMEEGTEAIIAIGLRAKARKNRVTESEGAVQLRLGLDGAWYRFDPDPTSGWVLAAGPTITARDALADSGPGNDRGRLPRPN